jgi:DNA-binding MarR family transcriptional regulator
MANRLARRPSAKAEPAPAAAGSVPRNGDLQLGILPSSLGYLLRRLQLAYKKQFLQAARPINLQPQHVGAMYVVGLNPGVTPSQMSAALGLDAVHTALMLNALEERGLIVRQLAANDRRSRIVHLTPAGRKTFAKLQAIASQVERDFVGDALTAQETAQLVSLMARLLSARSE